MDPRNPDRQGLDSISVLLDEALRNVLQDVSEHRFKTKLDKLRTAGLSVMALAPVCVYLVAMHPAAKQASGWVLWATPAVTLLIGGGALLDHAAELEVRRHQGTLKDPLQGALSKTKGVPLQPAVRLRRYHGISMLVLAAFCLCVAAISIPGEFPYVPGMWPVFALAMVGLGIWQIRKSLREQVKAREMTDTLIRSQPTRAASLLRRIK